MKKPPAGDKVQDIRLNHTALSDLINKIKTKTGVVKIKTQNGNGWFLISEKKIHAAYFCRNSEELLGDAGLVVIEQELKNFAEVGVYKIPNKIIPFYRSLYPELVVGDYKNVSVEVRMKDEISTASKSDVNVSQFSEEWEEAKETEKPKEERTDILEKEEKTERKDEISNIEVSENVRKALEEEIEEEVEIEKDVENFEEFLYSLKGFTGVVHGVEGSSELTAYMLNGKIVGASLKDEDLFFTGNSALFYFDTPAKVKAIRKKPEDLIFPPEMRCEDVSEAKRSIYKSI